MLIGNIEEHFPKEGFENAFNVYIECIYFRDFAQLKKVIFEFFH
jgi:hypothetical protein